MDDAQRGPARLLRWLLGPAAFPDAGMGTAAERVVKDAAAAVADDIKAIYGMGYFDDVAIYRESLPSGGAICPTNGSASCAGPSFTGIKTFPPLHIGCCGSSSQTDPGLCK